MVGLVETTLKLHMNVPEARGGLTWNSSNS
jgi:hypothetical protein